MDTSGIFGFLGVFFSCFGGIVRVILNWTTSVGSTETVHDIRS